MTQPTQAVGGEAPAPAESAVETFEAMAAEMLGEDDEEEEQPATEEEGEQPDEEAEPDEEEIEPEAPAIDPPNSFTAEEKEAFKGWPRDAQEAISRRVSELTNGLQSKAQEAAQLRQTAQLEAMRAVEQVKAQTAEQLQAYAKQFEVPPPSAALFAQNPEAYAQQLEAYQHYSAQREKAQRDAETTKAEQAQVQAARQAHEAEIFRQRLTAELPEIFDPDSGQELVKQLNATAEILGFDPNEISDVAAIKALKVTSEWKTKAEKYDALNKTKMEKVRSGKGNPPPITKPGTARLPEQTRKVRADQAWQAATSAKTRNAKDEALATWMENSGWL